MCSDIIYTESNIAEAIFDLSHKLNDIINVEKYGPPIYVCVLNGAVQFFADITKLLPSGNCIYIQASSYGDNQTAGQLIIDKLPDKLQGGQIFIFDDICDDGNTLKTIKEEIHARCDDNHVYTVAFINRCKPGKVVPYLYAIETSAPTFFAGYGMDNKGLDRNLPFIYDCTEA